MPKCDMTSDCTATVTHIDEKGWVYCTPHGIDRRYSGIHCRKLRSYELNRLASDKPIRRY